MPETTAVTAILDEVEDRMGNITTANGYNYTLKRIDRAMLKPWRGIDLPAVNIWATNVSNEKDAYGMDRREIQLFIELHTLTRDENFIDVAEKLAADGVTALNRRANATSGTSKSATGPVEDMSAETDVAFKISVDADSVETVTCVWTGATSGTLVAAQMQTQIQVLGGSKAGVTVVFRAGRYVITSSTTGVSSSVVVTPGATLSCTDELKIGVAVAGALEVSGAVAAPTVAATPSYDLGDTIEDVIFQGYDYVIGEGQDPFCGALLKFGLTYLTDPFDMINYARE